MRKPWEARAVASRQEPHHEQEKSMAKKITGYLKLQVPAGSANPSPPIGPALGQRGLNIMEFCKAFNAQTQKLEKGAPFRSSSRSMRTAPSRSR